LFFTAPIGCFYLVFGAWMEFVDFADSCPLFSLLDKLFAFEGLLILLAMS
jgi:hypothetical protein